MLDLITAFLTMSNLYWGLYTNVVNVLLILLFLKGVYTIFTSAGDGFFLGLGILDLVTGVVSYASVNHNMFGQVALFTLTLLGFKALWGLLNF